LWKKLVSSIKSWPFLTGNEDGETERWGDGEIKEFRNADGNGTTAEEDNS
jgi:hypothetical protein